MLFKEKKRKERKKERENVIKKEIRRSSESECLRRGTSERS